VAARGSCVRFVAPPLAAQETAKYIIAAHIRAQGYSCIAPQSARRDIRASRPDEAVWLLKCKDATYRVRLVPDMAANVEKIN
jgi:hypothetical protein